MKNLKLMEQYSQELKKYPGDMVEKFKCFIENNVDTWADGSDSLIYDVLDDKSMNAGELLEVLQSIIEFDGACQKFTTAVLTMKLYLKREQQKRIEKINTSNHIEWMQALDLYEAKNTVNTSQPAGLWTNGGI